MKLLRSPFMNVLCFVVFVSLLSTLVAFAAPSVATATPIPDARLCKQSPTLVDKSAPTSTVIVPCCFGKQAPIVNPSKSTPTQVSDGCCILPKIAAPSVNGKASLQPPQSACCEVVGKWVFSKMDNFSVDGVAPCAPPTPAPAPTCGLDMPDGSVVGSLPNDQRAFWAPGQISPDVTINAGTYWVTGVGTAANGAKFYRIIVACQYLYVPVDTMQPSYQPPWNGQPLPTNEVS